MEGDNFHNQLALNHHSEYDISDLTSEYGDGPAQIEVNLPQGDPNIDRILFWVGFDLMDADTGWHNADDPVCSGEVAIYESQLTGDREGTIDTDDPSAGRPDRCRVTFTTTPLGAGAMVPPGSPPPLPDLVVDDLTVDRSSGNLAVHVRNRGQASWAGKDLDMRVLWPSGEVFGEFTMPNVTIAPGDRVTLMHGGMDPHPALGACVLLDPNNDVQEVIDREIASGLFSGRPRYCRPLPDLSITDAQYNPSSHQLEVSINNYGEVTGLSGVTDGSLDGANLNMRITVPEGRPMTRTFTDVSIGVRGTKVLDWPLSDIERGRMHGGYTITVDPNNDVAETNDDNNSYELPGSTRLRLVWSCGFAEFCVSGSNLLGGRNTWDLRLYAIVSGGGSHQVVADWQSPEFSINWHDANHFWCTGEPHVSDWFELAGDQELVVSRSAGLDIVGHGYRWLDGGADALRTENNFGGVTLIPADLNPQRFVGQVPCDYDAGPSWGTAGCGVLTGPNLSQEGVHRSGQIYASGEGINGTCRWATSYGVYQAE